MRGHARIVHAALVDVFFLVRRGCETLPLGIWRGILADVDPRKIAKHVKKNDWNEYRILCQGNRIQFWINGHQTVSYAEKKASARKKGVIGFQLHVGPPMKVSFKDVILKELP